ncbi:alpha/beta hydrolase [Nocardiopsis sp. HNM0947]|uniref:Alpha/beta hydrolase n=1 Tax=Nocardiopsis coralli TaxID=2772213 RepID=A0ABR9P5R2_9ACTN|nr:alpha/beta hydrolase [Nocardiopsis coralli]MBE2999189.1 alpha/beta hydrolase [Nocardiopsis coralli]
MTERIATAADGSDIRGFDEGEGPPVIVLHPGMDDGTSWDRVSARLAPRFRVVRLHRRTYRTDLHVDPRGSLGQEADDVAAAARALGGRAVLVGHSSGAVVALEAMAASPSSFAGAVLYEPPAPVEGIPLGGEALRRAEAELARGRTGRAITIFMRDIVRYPGWPARVFGLMVGAVPYLRPRARRQLVDCEAMDRAGVRTAEYSGIGVPVLFLLGQRSPSHLHRRTEALRGAIPGARVSVLPGQGHMANRLRPARVADLVEGFHDAVTGLSAGQG